MLHCVVGQVFIVFVVLHSSLTAYLLLFFVLHGRSI